MKQKSADRDLSILLTLTLIVAVTYLTLGDVLIAFGKSDSNPLIVRLLVVGLAQFGLAGLGMTVVMLSRHEKFWQYGLVKRNILQSALGCLAVCIPAVIFMLLTGEIKGFFPFGGMLLTREVLEAGLPLNVIGYLFIALIWGFFESMNYVVMCKKINDRYQIKSRWLNWGAITCAFFCITIHGMLSFDFLTIIEAITTFILIYGMLMVKEYTGNAWGCVLIFFVVWNAM